MHNSSDKKEGKLNFFDSEGKHFSFVRHFYNSYVSGLVNSFYYSYKLYGPPLLFAPQSFKEIGGSSKKAEEPVVQRK